MTLSDCTALLLSTNRRQYQSCYEGDSTWSVHCVSGQAHLREQVRALEKIWETLLRAQVKNDIRAHAVNFQRPEHSSEVGPACVPSMHPESTSLPPLACKASATRTAATNCHGITYKPVCITIVPRLAGWLRSQVAPATLLHISTGLTGIKAFTRSVFSIPWLHGISTNNVAHRYESDTKEEQSETVHTTFVIIIAMPHTNRANEGESS